MGVHTVEFDGAVFLFLPYSGRGSFFNIFHTLFSVFDNKLAPAVDIFRTRPPVVDRFNTQLVGHIHPLKQMKHEQRRISQGKYGVIGDGTGPGNPGIEFTEVHFAIVLINQEIQFKVPLVSLFSELVAN